MLAKAWISAVLFSTAMGAQSPAFEVATVKLATGSGSIGWLSYPGGRLEITNCTLNQIIHLAYGFEDFQISGGPAWVGRDVWDIKAKAPSSSEAARYVPKTPKYPPA